MLSSQTLISTAEEIAELAQILKTYKVIAFDTEFIRESTFFPIVEIIQVATETDTWLVDAQTFKRSFRPGDPESYDPNIVPLLNIFSDPNILKIVHASQGDQECLYTSFGVVATPSFDTAVGASLCGLGDGVGLGKLLKSVLDVTLHKGHARTNWSVRPLPKQLMDYATADVLHLVKLGTSLLEKLDELGRKKWALELSAKWENVQLYQANVKEIANKISKGGRLDKHGFATLLELVKWRESRVRQLNLPRRWLADDHVLLDLSHVRPTDLGHLGTFRGLNKGEVKNHGEAILAILNQPFLEPAASSVSEAAIDLNLLKRASRQMASPNQDESQVLDLLRCYIGILADRHKVAAKHLMTTDKLLLLLRSEIKSPRDLITIGILTEESAALVGEELVEMIHGKRALLMKERQIEIMKIN